MKCRVAFSLLGAVFLSAVTAHSAFALETILPQPSFQLPTSPSDRDPYLAQAINSLPNYSFTEAGSAHGTVSPITETAQWVKPHRIAAARPQTPPAIDLNSSAILVLEGEASYYSRAGCLGCSPNLTMANGQPLNDNALTMAIGADKKHLVGRPAQVTNMVTGQSVTVIITDTGGFYQSKYGNRVADLTIATKQAIGINGGLGQVRVEVF